VPPSRCPTICQVGARRFDESRRPSGDRANLAGGAALDRGLELRALRFGCCGHPLLRREVCGGDFEGELRRSDFGAGFGVPYVADRVRLLVQVEGIRR